ncbi:MAG: flagellar biosynthesis protein FlhF [Spirochaetes bacterium]|nr:MAG: flagellar biosynthesis protein FlhF [Spirochaetota bacterium]
MIYKIYRAPSYKEAVLKAKMELGNDIYILSRKDIKEGGVFGLFSKKLVEITVAKKEEKVMDKKANSRKIEVEAPVSKKNNEISEDYQKRLFEELNAIKGRLNDLIDGDKKKENNKEILSPYKKLFKENDFSESFIRNWELSFEKELTLKDAKDPKVIVNRIVNYINGLVEIADPIAPGKDKPEVVVLVGPTGVGKTTTIAKLAATYGVLKKHKVELVTIDSYRIAAIEQLGKYAELMQIPLTIINTREEFKEYLRGCNAELVFVDTAGRSQKNNMGLAELRNVLDGARGKLDIHLVISATTKYRDAVDIFTRFNQLLYEKVIITKLDETNTVGSIISALEKNRKLSYFTTGQSVPDDIELASKEKIVKLLAFDELIDSDVENKEIKVG